MTDTVEATGFGLAEDRTYFGRDGLERAMVPTRREKDFLDKEDCSFVYGYHLEECTWDDENPLEVHFQLYNGRNEINLYTATQIRKLYDVLAKVLHNIRDMEQEMSARDAKLQEQTGEGDSQGA